MSATENNLVNSWLDRLNELQPPDGRLSHEILVTAGEFPVEKPPGDAFDYKDDPVKASQYYKGLVARRFAFEMAGYRVNMATYNSEKLEGQAAADSLVNARYWTEISEWLRTLLS